MLPGDQESCTSSNSQDSGKAASKNIPPQSPSIPIGDIIAPGEFAINTLLEELLLEIFACYVEESQPRDAWHTLACVCRKWRGIILGSPRRLKLRIFCSERIPVRKNLDIWPPFPIVLTVDFRRKLGKDNILATLERHDRACQVTIWRISKSLWEEALPLMQKPFPILTDLTLHYTHENKASVIPDSFLGGSAPGLRKLNLGYFPFPELPKLLLSTTDLVYLELREVPASGYISADTMATCLSTLTRLEFFMLCFQSSHPLPEWGRRRTSPSTRTHFPSLTDFTLKGPSEYLGDIVGMIEAPLVDRLRIKLFRQPMIDTTRLAQFISRLPKLKACNDAIVHFNSLFASSDILSLSKTTTKASPKWDDLIEVEAGFGQLNFQLSPLAQLFASSIPQVLIPTVERLILVGDASSEPNGEDSTDPSQLRELLQPFAAVKDLYLTIRFAPYIALLLQELVGESVMDLLPVLQNIFITGPESSRLVPEGIEQFVAARQLANHHISVSHWLITR